jgi:tRNA A-37 threonylcarbamoyl transferase component Bud32
MCQLTSYDSENLTLSLKWVGKSMMYFINQGKQIKTARKQAIKSNTPVNQDLTHCKLLLSKNEFINQWEVICKTLEENNIVHLDLWPTNICINNNVVTLIDFGKVIIDENPQSAKLEEEYQNFLTQGGYNFQKNQQLDKIFSKVNRKLSWV